MDFKAKYHELRKSAKQLIFENHALHSEIVQCKGEVCIREAERELLLQHLLEYEQEEWELQREMTNAHTEKHRMIKKQQDADKRKKMRAAESLISEEDGQKIPKIKIVFQQKRGPEVIDANMGNFELNETKIAIKNKIRRNKSKLEPIVISLPTSSLNGLSGDKDYLHTNKRHKTSISITPQSANSVYSQEFISNFGSSSSSIPSVHNSPAADISPSNSNTMVAESLSNTSDTPIDVFSESDNNDSINVSPSNSGSDISHAEPKHLDNKMLFYVDENSLPLSGNESLDIINITSVMDGTNKGEAIVIDDTESSKSMDTVLR